MKQKKIPIAWLFVLIWISNISYAFAQKNDYIWLTGGGSYARNDTTSDSVAGNVKLDFNYDPVQITFDSISMYFNATDVAFSDSNGNLLFYSNGIYVANAQDVMIENGDSLNVGDIVYQWGTTQIGEDINQGILALPNVANSNQYYLVYPFDDTVPGSGGGDNYITKIYNSLIDMHANNGMGQVAYKNMPIISTVSSSALTATRHGNGRDWWLLIQKNASNCFYEVLLDSSGFQVIDSSCIGAVTPLLADNDRVCFSPDGSKFIFLNLTAGLTIYDFDRCSGKLSNYQYLPLIPANIDSGNRSGGVSVSPSNRFLYVSTAYRVFQFDLWSDNVWGSIDTIGVYDGWYLWGPGDASLFGTSQIGPDGKIYISSIGSVPVYSVINSPNEQGAACNFAQHSVELHGLQYGIPNYPNYRLGALSQSQCDTLASLSQVQRAAKEQIINVYPNPATDYAIIDYGFTDWSKGEVYLQLCNTLGQTVYTQPLPMYSGLQKIDVNGFANGMYMVFIKRQNEVVATSKLVKQ